mmetsp:Transcript_12129/g.13014  ORF Transcript_12129/g.13014 Transcript_12129/m.13014 type:complete len:159 (-) Transcript_12129:414-890(-)
MTPLLLLIKAIRLRYAVTLLVGSMACGMALTTFVTGFNTDSVPVIVRSVTAAAVHTRSSSSTSSFPSFATRTSSSSKSSQLRMTVLSYGGKKKNFKAGTPLSKALPQIGIKPRYSCKKGDCATCQVFIAGRATRACIGKVPPEPTLKSLKEKGLEVRP